MLDRRSFLSGSCFGLAASLVAGADAGPSPSSLPVAGDFDVVVAGGSTTGVCAAVRAAQAGCTVALVEMNAFFGGTATAGLVPVWHSLWSTDGKTQIIGGLTEEIENRLIARGEARQVSKTDRSIGCYMNVAALELVLDDLVRENPSIRPFLRARVVAAETDGAGTVRSIAVEDKSGRRVIRGRYFIDATGDADLVRRAGFPTWIAPKTDLQGHSTCAILANVPEIRKVHPNFSFREVMKPASGAGLKHVFQWQAPIIGAEQLTFLAATRVYACDPSDADDLTRGEMEGREQLRRIVDTANRLYPMPQGKRLALVAVAPSMGLRESRHICAEYRVTDEDVLTGRRFDDCIAKGSYRVDIHEGAGITFRYLDGTEEKMSVTESGDIAWRRGRWRAETASSPTWYEIPLRALKPKGAKNLVCAGRMLDCTRAAYGALRVMVNCNQMGEAAGRHAAACVKA